MAIIDRPSNNPKVAELLQKEATKPTVQKIFRLTEDEAAELDIHLARNGRMKLQTFIHNLITKELGWDA